MLKSAANLAGYFVDRGLPSVGILPTSALPPSPCSALVLLTLRRPCSSHPPSPLFLSPFDTMYPTFDTLIMLYVDTSIYRFFRYHIQHQLLLLRVVVQRTRLRWILHLQVHVFVRKDAAIKGVPDPLPPLALVQTSRTPVKLTPSPKCSPGEEWLNAPAALPPTCVP